MSWLEFGVGMDMVISRVILLGRLLVGVGVVDYTLFRVVGSLSLLQVDVGVVEVVICEVNRLVGALAMLQVGMGGNATLYKVVVLLSWLHIWVRLQFLSLSLAHWVVISVGCCYC